MENLAACRLKFFLILSLADLAYRVTRPTQPEGVTDVGIVVIVLYSIPSHIADASDLCVVQMWVRILYICMSNILCICSFVATFVSSRQMAVTFEVDVAVGCVLARVNQCQIDMPIRNDRSVPYIFSVAAIFFRGVFK